MDYSMHLTWQASQDNSFNASKVTDLIWERKQLIAIYLVKTDCVFYINMVGFWWKKKKPKLKLLFIVLDKSVFWLIIVLFLQDEQKVCTFVNIFYSQL